MITRSKLNIGIAIRTVVNNFNTFFMINHLWRYRATGVDGNEKLLKIVPDWTEEAANDDHLWSVTSHNVDFCYIGESECSVSKHLICFYSVKDAKKNALKTNSFFIALTCVFINYEKYINLYNING